MFLRFIFLLLFSFSAWAQSLESLMKYEKINSHFSKIINKKANKSYQTGRKVEIEIYKIPVKYFEQFSMSAIPKNIREFAFIEEGRDIYIRFPLHPAAKDLYGRFVSQFPKIETITVMPTSSMRTVSLRNEFFIKLGVNLKQLGIGRVIPDWEVRRSIKVSENFYKNHSHVVDEQGISFIKEPLGFYLKSEYSGPAWAAKNQPVVLQHGFIYRDGDFIKGQQELIKMPLFTLFEEQKKAAPFIIQWWKEDPVYKNRTLQDYFQVKVIEPLIRKLSFLVFELGYIPDAHGQNLLVGINPITKSIEHLYVRDLGSVKVNILLRMSKGYSIKEFLEGEFIWDYKPDWANRISYSAFENYLYRYIFSNSFLAEVTYKKYDPRYSFDLSKIALDAEIKYQLKKYFPSEYIPQQVGAAAIEKMLENYLRDNPPTEQYLNFAQEIHEENARDWSHLLPKEWNLTGEFKYISQRAHYHYETNIEPQQLKIQSGRVEVEMGDLDPNIYVLKMSEAGKEKYFYLNEKNIIKYFLNKDRTLRVMVVEDISHHSDERQKVLIEEIIENLPKHQKSRKSKAIRPQIIDYLPPHCDKYLPDHF